MAQKITKTLVDSIEVTGRLFFLWDTEIKGFGVRVTPAGAISYVFKFRLQKGREHMPIFATIGKHGNLAPAQARAIAMEWAPLIAKGIHPKPVTAAVARLTLAEFCRHSDLADYEPTFAGQKPGQYFAKHALIHKKPSSIKSDISILRASILPTLGRKDIKAITRNDIIDLHASLYETPYRANRALSLLSKIFSLAEDFEVRDKNNNPCKRVKKYKEHTRERAPDINDLYYIGEAMNEMERMREEEPSILGLVRAIILSGTRRSEMKDCRWEWVDLDARAIYLPDSKTGRKKISMPKPLAQVFKEMQEIYPKSLHVFPNPNRHGACYADIRDPWYRILKRAKALAERDGKKVRLDGVRVHDMRHAYATIAEEALNGNVGLVSKLLHHGNITTTQRYLHTTDDRVQAGAETTSNVIALALGRKGV